MLNNNLVNFDNFFNANGIIFSIESFSLLLISLHIEFTTKKTSPNPPAPAPPTGPAAAAAPATAAAAAPAAPAAAAPPSPSPSAPAPDQSRVPHLATVGQ